MPEKKIISLEKLYFTDFVLQDIFSMRQVWKEGVSFKRSVGRPMTAFLLLNRCTGKYVDQSGETFLAPKKSIVCLPYGSKYTCINLECSNTLEDAIIVDFNIVSGGDILTFAEKPFLIKDVNTLIANNLFKNVVQAYEASASSPLAVRTAIYNLLSYICKERLQKYQTHFAPISAGIELLETDPLCSLSTEEIAHACNVSTCHFRRLFKEYSGKSPSEYRMDLRLNMAKSMLQSDEVTMEYIAEALNFESTSYFCRVFKKKMGMTPGQYKAGVTPEASAFE